MKSEVKEVDGYYRKVLDESNDHQYIFITWPVGSKSRPHDHGRSKGIIRVIEGTIFQEVYDKKTKKFLRRTVHGPGSIIKETPDIIHVMGNDSKDKIAKTRHYYSPPLKMRYYSPKKLVTIG